MQSLMQQVEKNYLKKKVPKFDVGDTVKVYTKIVEGDKERTQVYQGTVVGKKGSGMSETFTVSRVSFGVANEKVFSVQSPFMETVEVLQKGKVRRAKLNYIRGRVGKKARIAADVGALSKNKEEAPAETKEETPSEVESASTDETKEKTPPEVESASTEETKEESTQAEEKTEEDKNKEE